MIYAAKYDDDGNIKRGEILEVTYQRAKVSGDGEDAVFVTYFITDPDVVRWFIWYKEETQHLHNGKGRVFMQWRGGEPHWQPYGYKFFTSGLYRDIAKLLQLPNWNEFTGHSMCRTAASFFTANGMHHIYFFIHLFL